MPSSSTLMPRMPSSLSASAADLDALALREVVAVLDVDARDVVEELVRSQRRLAARDVAPLHHAGALRQAAERHLLPRHGRDQLGQRLHRGAVALHARGVAAAGSLCVGEGGGNRASAVTRQLRPAGSNEKCDMEPREMG
jgi:hypothetical protein